MSTKLIYKPGFKETWIGHKTATGREIFEITTEVQPISDVIGADNEVLIKDLTQEDVVNVYAALRNKNNLAKARLEKIRDAAITDAISRALGPVLRNPRDGRNDIR